MAYFVFDLNWPSMTVGLLCSVQGHSQKGGGALIFPIIFPCILEPRELRAPPHTTYTQTHHTIYTQTHC